MALNIPFTRILEEGDTGPDVEAVGRALCRAKCFINIRIFNRAPKKWRQNFGTRKVAALRKFEAKKALAKDGKYGSKDHLRLARYFDGKAVDLMKSYKPPPPKPPPVPQIEPNQGWRSLVPSLWGEYSLARSLGLSDLGTYNPASRLPSGARSDHAQYPAQAFDVGFWPYPNRAAFNFFNEMAGDDDVDYVIYGSMIWSRSSGLHRYNYGGHYNHIHVSAR